MMRASESLPVLLVKFNMRLVHHSAHVYCWCSYSCHARVRISGAAAPAESLILHFSCSLSLIFTPDSFLCSPANKSLAE